MKKQMNMLRERIEYLQTPILVITGENDKSVNNEKVKEVFDLIPAPDKEYKMYPGFDHFSLWIDGEY